MLAFHAQSVAQGPAFLAEQGSRAFVGGLAAMPPLHAGTAFLFLLFAWRYGKALVPFFGVFFAYIAIMAIASRWHHAVDLPAGLVLAWVSLTIAERLVRPERLSRAPRGDLRGQA